MTTVSVQQGFNDWLASVQRTIDDLQTTITNLQGQIGILQTSNSFEEAQVAKLQLSLSQAQTALQAFLGTVPTFESIEELTTWQQPGNVGNTGGGSTAPHGTFTLAPATPAVFSAVGAVPYDNGYWFAVLDNAGKYSNATAFKYAMEIMATAADLAASQAIEFELQLTVNGAVFNMAWQMRLVPPNQRVWYVFNYSTGSWEPTSIAVDPSIFTGQWGRILAEFTKNPDGTVTHVALSVNGTRNVVNLVHASKPNVYPGSNALHAAFQLDCNGGSPPTPYKVQVRNMHVYIS